MAIEDLMAVVPAPAHPLETGTVGQWRQIQKDLGIRLPKDFRDFGQRYGTGRFTELGITVFNPFAAVFREWLDESLAVWRTLKAGEGDEEVPYDVFPVQPGLLVWGADEGGAGLFWLTIGEPDRWPIMLRGHESTEFHRIELSLSTFLAKVMRQEISVPDVWSKRMFAKRNALVFQPLALRPRLAGKSVYQLYAENGNSAGFWVAHPNWEGQSTEVLVKRIDGKTKGPLRGEAPDYGMATVLTDIYENGAIYECDAELTIAFDLNFRKVDAPTWWTGDNAKQRT